MRTYKNPGELERVGLEPLPPTPMSPEAKEKIESWGVTEEQIDHIRDFTSQFRYDLCPQKVDRLSQVKAEIFHRGDQEYINLPSFFDVEGRLDGQCGDIGRQWIVQAHEIGLIDELNAQRTDGNKIATGFYTGLSKTHFHNVGATHVWSGLALLDSEGLPLDEIFCDASFQTIMSRSESGYTQRTGAHDIAGIETDENIDLPVGWVEINGKFFNGQVLGSAVLGISSDFKYSYSLGFLRDIHTSEMRPILESRDADSQVSFFINGEQGELLASNNGLYTHPTDEIGEILSNARRIETEERAPTINSVNWTRRDVSGGTTLGM